MFYQDVSDKVNQKDKFAKNLFQGFCQVHHSELVAIETPEENAFIRDQVKNRSGK